MRQVRAPRLGAVRGHCAQGQVLHPQWFVKTPCTTRCAMVSEHRCESLTKESKDVSLQTRAPAHALESNAYQCLIQLYQPP